MNTISPADLPKRRPVDLVITEALAELDSNEDRPLDEILAQLTNVSEVLSKILETSSETVQSPFPGLQQ